MSTTVTAPPKGKAGIIDGKLLLSQGVTREIKIGEGRDFKEIPVIDLSALNSRNPDPSEKARLITEILDACTHVGFFVIKNHGIEWSVVEETFQATEEFFNLPMEKKMEISQSKSPSYQGYEHPYYSNVDRLKKGDLKEAITISYDPHVDEHGVGDAMPKILIREPLWPDADILPRFRPAIEAYRAACLDLMRKLIRVLAIAIGEREDFFDKKMDYPVAAIRALHYPPQTASEDEVTGHGAHTDVQTMTMIAQKPYNIQALEVMNSAGEWIQPTLEPETFIVNLGDMLGRLTNDTFLSTVHRVRNKTTEDRYSLPFFFGVSNDELITTLPQFITPENPLKEEYRRGMTGYEHYNRRLQLARHNHPSAVNSVSPALPPGMMKIDGVLVGDV